MTAIRQQSIKATIAAAYPTAKIVRDNDGEIVISLPENQMTDAEMDEVRSAIASALPAWATLTEEEGALLSITWGCGDGEDLPCRH